MTDNRPPGPPAPCDCTWAHSMSCPWASKAYEPQGFDMEPRELRLPMPLQQQFEEAYKYEDSLFSRLKGLR